MQHEGFFEKAYYGSTFLHPLGATVLLTLGLLTIALPRRSAIVPLIILTNFVPCSQRIAIAGLDFNLLRIMIIFGWTRLFVRGEWSGLKLNKLDKLFIWWGIAETVIYVMLWRNPGALVTMCGRMMEAHGGYFMVRCMVRDWDDLLNLAKWVAIIAIPVGIFFIIEKSTGRNYFSVFGGVPPYTWKREGKLRAMGAISNPILAGCYWASMMPIVGALWWSYGKKMLALFGSFCCVFVVFACASSTPLASLMAAMLGAYLFKYRHYMAEIRKGVLYTLLVLHILKSMRGKPVWHLLSSIDLVGGSTGWHRYNLIEQWKNRFTEWALLGTKWTGHWGWGLWDITNQYVLESVRGGLLTLIIFIWMIVVAWKYLGVLWRSVEHNKERVALAWGLGAMLFVHCCSFIAVSYFGQMVIGWYMTLALIGTLYAHYLTTLEDEQEAEVTEEEKPFVPIPKPRRRKRLIGAA